jgi:hypothetical protein
MLETKLLNGSWKIYLCGDELAVGIKPRLPFGLADGSGSFFLEQRGENQRRKSRGPRKRGSLIRGAAERRDKFKRRRALQFFREQSRFELREFVFLRRAQWRGGIGWPFESRGRRETGI